MYQFDEEIDRHGCDQVKYDFVGRVAAGLAPDVLPMWIADMDFAAYPPLVEALHKRVDRQTFGYSLHKTAAFYGAIQAWLQYRFSWQVKEEDIHYTPGMMTAIAFLIQGCSAPGDGVIIQPPVYDSFAEVIERGGRQVVENALLERADGSYEMDFADLEEKLKKPENRILLLCSPHNPVGRIWREDELRKVGELCARYGVFLISDESHCDLVRKGLRHIPVQQLFPGSEGIATCMTPSKTFGISGFQIGYVVLQGKAIREIWERESMRFHIFHPNSLAITALEAVYDSCRDYYEQSLPYLDANLELVADFIRSELPLARCSVPEATYLAWIDLRRYGYAPEEIMGRCLYKGKVVPDNGATFGKGGEGFIRLNVGCPRKTVEEGLARLRYAME